MNTVDLTQFYNAYPGYVITEIVGAFKLSTGRREMSIDCTDPAECKKAIATLYKNEFVSVLFGASYSNDKYSIESVHLAPISIEALIIPKL